MKTISHMYTIINVRLSVPVHVAVPVLVNSIYLSYIGVGSKFEA